jgi:hypothetical protein
MIKDEKDNNPSTSSVGDAMRSAQNNRRDTQQQQPQFDNRAAGADTRRTGAPLAGFASLNSFLNRPLSRNGIGEHTMSYVEVFREFIAKELPGQEKKYAVLPIERNAYDLPLSVIVVAAAYRGKQGTALLAYPILLEPLDSLPSRVWQSPQGELEVPTAACDAYDDRTKQAVINVVQNHWSLDTEVTEVSYNTIPNDLDPKDVRRLGALMTMAINTIDGIAKELPGNEEPRFNTAMIVGSPDEPTGITVSGRMDFAPATLETVTGLPIRNDISVTTKLVMPNQDRTQIATSNAPILSQVAGYLDLSYVEPEVTVNQFGQSIKSTNCYQARYVMTNTNIETNAMTPELALFGLASTRMLSQNHAWVSGFRKRHGIKDDTRDIGAIGYEVNLSNDGSNQLGKIDTGAQDFDLFQLIRRAFLPNLLYSLDVEEGGDDSWVWLSLQYAAQGDQDAYRDILDTAENLTLGHFGRYWQGGEIARHSGNLIHLGYFTTPEGKEDIRKLDYLALLNMLGQDHLADVIAFSDTFDPNMGDPTKRLADRTRILRGLFQNNIHFKGWANRYDLNGAFLDALAAGIRDAGMVIVPETVYGEFTRTARGNNGLADFAVQSGNSPLFQAAQPRGGNANFGASMFTPRMSAHF